MPASFSEFTCRKEKQNHGDTENTEKAGLSPEHIRFISPGIGTSQEICSLKKCLLRDSPCLSVPPWSCIFLFASNFAACVIFPQNLSRVPSPRCLIIPRHFDTLRAAARIPLTNAPRCSDKDVRPSFVGYRVTSRAAHSHDSSRVAAALRAGGNFTA
jgi:hypothetical protein